MSRRPENIPAEVIGVEALPRHDQGLIDQLGSLPDASSAVADALDELGRGAVIAHGKLTPLDIESRIVGQAVTLRYRPLDGDATTNRRLQKGTVLGDRDLYGLAEHGDIAVIEANSVADAAVMGGISAAWAAKAGVGGCIIDGLIRDTESIRNSQLPVWSAGRTSRAARYRVEVDAINRPVAVASVTIYPGDFIVADQDGICVVPFELLPEVVRLTQQAQVAEDDLMGQIHESVNLEELIERTREAQHL